jgi:sulfate adenylyltransferase
MANTKAIILSERQLCDLEMLLNGSYAPLTGYLGQADYQSVMDQFQLTNGEFFPVPIVLDVPESQAKSLSVGETIHLSNSENLPLAELVLEEIYQPDLSYECEKVLGTTDLNHPYARYLLDRPETTFYLSGQLKQLNQFLHSDFHRHRLTPIQAREAIREHGWTNVVGFQTRNPMHRCHYEVTRYLTEQVATESGQPTGLLLTPTVGVTQECDIDYFTRVKCYVALIEKYPERGAHLCLLPLAMRMAGPREALLHAVIRRNYGCTHFIIGRDHAGPSYKPSDPSKSSFYGPYEAHELATRFRDRLGIEILLMKEMVYLSNRDQYLPVDQVQEDDVQCQISGTKFREMLLSGEEIPTWFSYPEIIGVLRENVKSPAEQGFCVYFIGLSGSGKTTLVKYLKNHLMERRLNKRQLTILDADIVRQHLSKGLGFSAEDRSTNIQRIGFVASLVVQHGGICLVANIAPFERDRAVNRELIRKNGHYIEVYVKTPVDVCETRDCKGLYGKAKRGEIKLTGVNDPFEEPTESQFVVNSSEPEDLEKAVEDIVAYLVDKQLID